MTNTENIEIDIKDYDKASFGIRVFDETKGFGDINDLVAIAEINGDPSKEVNREEFAIANALEKLVEKHKKELAELYNSELKKIDNGYYD